MIVWRRLAEFLAAHGRAALVTVHEVRGSAPREAGARMVVRPDGAFHGTIGGGQLEWQMLGAAREALERGRGPARFVEQALGPDLGQCCGGRVSVLIETFDRSDAEEIARLAEAEALGDIEIACRMEEGRVRRSALPPPLPGGAGVGVVGPGEGVAEGAPPVRAAHFVPTARARPRDPHPRPLPARGRGEWAEPPSDPLTPLLLFGAGHVGRALVLALAPLPFRVRWIDSREDAFPAHIPANAAAVRTADPEAEIATAPENAFVLVMTHEHPLDLALTAAALRRPFPYVGLIGSATKRARFEKRFRELGIPEPRIGGLVCPIGLPGIGGKEPAVIAAATVAQMLQVRENVASRLDPPGLRDRA